MIKTPRAGQFALVGSLTLVVAPEASAAERSTEGAKDAEARLRELFRQHYDFIWRSLRRLGLDAGRADDAAQQVFVTASRKLEGIRVGESVGTCSGSPFGSPRMHGEPARAGESTRSSAPPTRPIRALRSRRRSTNTAPSRSSTRRSPSCRGISGSSSFSTSSRSSR